MEADSSVPFLTCALIVRLMARVVSRACLAGTLCQRKQYNWIAIWGNAIIRGMDHNLVTTAFTLDGYRITRNLGLVRGIVVRSRSIFGTIGAGLQTIVGGNITLLSELCEKTREQAFEKMMTHAEQLGANAVIGVRYDATEVMQSVTEVLCYGTAVVIERNG